MHKDLKHPCHRLFATFLVLLASLGMGRAPAADFAANFGGLAGSSFNQTASTFDAVGNAYIVGTFTDASLTIGTVTISRIGVTDTLAAKIDTTGAVVWAKNFGGSGANAFGNSIAVDASGNVYLGGYFDSANLTTPALTNIGTRDAFAFKLDSAGASVWAKNFGGSVAYAIGQSIAVDASGNVYLGGYFSVANLTTPALTKIGDQDAFAFKLDSAGNSLWSKNFGGSGANALGQSIAVDASGNVYLSGLLESANLTTPALTRIGDKDAFAFKLNSVGTSVWSKNFGGSGAAAIGLSTAVDASGNVYLGGYFHSANLTTPALNIIGDIDAFAFKLDSAGTSVWSKNFGGGSGAQAFGQNIAVDASGNVYLGGVFQFANLTTPALTKIGNGDAFAFKLDSVGTSVWSKNFGGSAAFANGQSIAVDASGNVYLGGYFVNANLTIPALTNIGNQNTFAFKLDSVGNTTLAKGVSSLAPGGIIQVAATAVDATGNTYLSGYFDGVTATLGGITLTRLGINDVFVAKLNAAGSVLWAKNFGGSGANAQGRSIAVDASGNVYLGGLFNGANLTTPALSRIGNGDAFAFKLDSAGTSVWARNFGGSGAVAVGRGIAVDASGNVYLGGLFNGANLTTPALSKIGGTDAFAFKLNSAGTSVWARNFGGSGANAEGQSIAVDASGNVYLGGFFNNANLTAPALTRIGTFDAFAFKLDSTGTSVWSKNFGGSAASAECLSVAVDASGNVYLGGYFYNANLTTPALTKIGTFDAFAFKLNSAGTSVWSKNFGGTGAEAYGLSIAVDASGNVYLGGVFYNANLTTPALTRIGIGDAFAFKLDSAGTSVWARNFGGSAAIAVGRRIAVDASGNVYLGGVFQGANLTTPALTKIGNQDAFIIKQFAPNIPPASPTAVAATAGIGQATVTFTAPASDGGSAITGYTVTSIPAGGTDSNAGTTSLSHIVTGLTNGTAYTFTVVASNAAGASPPSAASNSVTPPLPANTTTTVSSSANPVVAGSAVTFTAAVAGATPTGTINFRSVGTTIAGCGAVSLVSGSAQCTTTFSTIGTRTIDADYSGNPSNAASTGTLSGGQSVIALQTLTVSLTGTGQGSVTGTGINCPGDCSEAVTQDTMVTLTATPATGSTFTGWSGGGGCTGTGTCTVTMSAATAVTAQFTRQLGSLSVSLSGLSAGGSVSLAINGPDGYSASQVVTTGNTLNLSNLPTGTYLINAPSTTISLVFYVPNVRLNSAEVTVGMTTNITITYRVALNSVAPLIYFLLED